jgi:hypothetical protein
MMAAAAASSIIIPLVLVLVLVVGPILEMLARANVTELGLKVSDNGQGEWSIDIVRGSTSPYLKLKITDPSARMVIYDEMLIFLSRRIGRVEDNNNNDRLDRGDSIILNQGGQVAAGMKFELVRVETVVGCVNRLPQPRNNGEVSLVLSVERRHSEDWYISIVNNTGSFIAQDVRIKITNTSSGTVLYEAPAAPSTGLAEFRDNNDDSKLSAGDAIVLSNYHNVDAGMRVEFVMGETVIGSISQLPA